MGFPKTDEELVAMAEKFGKRDGGWSEDDIDGLDEDELYDIADDAWYHSGWMEFENHPDIEEFMDEFSEKAASLKLSSKYQEAFVKAIQARD